MLQNRTWIYSLIVWGACLLVSAEFITVGPAYAQRGADYVVNTTDGTADGVCEALSTGTDCSLADAIIAANGSAGFNAIQFNIPGPGPHRISLATALPTITSPVLIDGLSQPNAVCPDGAGGGKIIIELDGSLLGFGVDGLNVTSSDNTIQGLAIFGFDGNGIELNGGNNNDILCNYVGTDSTGATIGVGNQLAAVYLNDSDDNLIEFNVVSGNMSTGIDLRFGSDNNVTQNNLIGTDRSGMAVLPNGSHGYFEGTGAANSRVLNNVASGNNGSGIVVKDTNNQIVGNLVGLDRTGMGALGNKANGIVIGPAFDSLVISNTIAFNADSGVNVFNITTRRVTVIENSIYDNGLIGIDLYNGPVAPSVTPNDAAPDSDLFANELQNYPVLTSAESNLSTITISGTLESAFSSQYRLHFYANPNCDPETGFGEGKTYLGTTNVTTNASGTATFAVTLAKVVGAGEAITATATDAVGNTSEFSACETTLVPTSVGLSGQATQTSKAQLLTFGIVLLFTSTCALSSQKMRQQMQ